MQYRSDKTVKKRVTFDADNQIFDWFHPSQSSHSWLNTKKADTTDERGVPGFTPSSAKNRDVRETFRQTEMGGQ